MTRGLTNTIILKNHMIKIYKKIFAIVSREFKTIIIILYMESGITTMPPKSLFIRGKYLQASGIYHVGL